MSELTTLTGIASFTSITILCYIIGIGVKASSINDNYIPAIVALVGVALGVVAYYLNVPDFPAKDILMAAAVGGVSGMASTGFNQIIKKSVSDK